MWKSLKQPAVTRCLKDIKDTLQQIKCNSRGKTKQTANFICAQGLFEGITEQLQGCSAQLVVSSLAEVDVYTLCLQSFFHFFVEMRETLVQPSGFFAPNQSCFFLKQNNTSTAEQVSPGTQLSAEIPASD